MKGYRLIVDTRKDRRRAECLAQAYLAGVDFNPSETTVEILNDHVYMTRPAHESGRVVVPWHVDGFGKIWLCTCQLMERTEPYRLVLELARAQISQARSTQSRLRDAGQSLAVEIDPQVQTAHSLFQRAVQASSPSESDAVAEQVIAILTPAIEQMSLGLCRPRIPQRAHVKTELACQVFPTFDNCSMLTQFGNVFDRAVVPVSWSAIEAEPGKLDFSTLDRWLDVLDQHRISYSLGPVLDFQPQALPGWLGISETRFRDVTSRSLAFLEATMTRYRARCVDWIITGSLNSLSTDALTEDHAIWLASKGVEQAESILQGAHLTTLVDQPWGEYRVNRLHAYSAKAFVDEINRLNPLSAIEVKLASGAFAPAGVCRTFFELNRLLNRFGDIGPPIHARLISPLENAQDANWVFDAFVVAVSNPLVERVSWGRFQDTPDGPWANGGLFDLSGKAKPAWGRLCDFRAELNSYVQTSE